MSNYIYRYPDGAVGLALLFFRISYALVAFGIAGILPGGSLGVGFPCLAASLVALLLLIGFVTRVVAVLLGMAVAVVLATAYPAQQLLLLGHVGGCAVIALIGPGAFSIDARRHGRRVIHLQAKTPDRGGDD